MSVQKEKQHSKDTEDETTVEPEDLSSDTDVTDILDEIDKVLEENAVEFVNNYVQKGGE